VRGHDVRGWIAALLACAACSPGKQAQTSSPSPSAESAPASPEAPKPLPSPLPRVAATVNGQPILSRLVTLFVKKIQGAQPIPPADKPRIYRSALEQCIDRELLFEEALSRGLSAEDRAVQRSFDEARVQHHDDASWATFLEDQRLTADGFKAEIRTEQTVAALLRQEAARIPEVSDAEARAYFDANPAVFETGERIRARRILIRVTPGTSGAGRLLIKTKNADKVLARLRAGEDFAKLARQVSFDAAAKGGDIGVVIKGQLPKEVEDQAFRLKPGEMTDVVETEEGFEIVKVDERLPSEKLTFEQAQPRLKKLLWEQKREKALASLLASLRAKSRVETFL
jgi:peptidyl-prolyl cis-trans isomerase C